MPRSCEESDAWYSLRRWRRRRVYQLRRYPLCAFCLARGLVVPASVVDHVEPHRGNRSLFELGALQSLCAPCHDGQKHVIEKRGYSTAIGLDGWPLDPRHPAWASQTAVRVVTVRRRAEAVAGAFSPVEGCRTALGGKDAPTGF